MNFKPQNEPNCVNSPSMYTVAVAPRVTDYSSKLMRNGHGPKAENSIKLARLLYSLRWHERPPESKWKWRHVPKIDRKKERRRKKSRFSSLFFSFSFSRYQSPSGSRFGGLSICLGFIRRNLTFRLRFISNYRVKNTWVFKPNFLVCCWFNGASFLNILIERLTLKIHFTTL